MRTCLYDRFLIALDGLAAQLEDAVATDEQSGKDLVEFLYKVPAEFWAQETRLTIGWIQKNLMSLNTAQSLN